MPIKQWLSNWIVIDLLFSFMANLNFKPLFVHIEDLKISTIKISHLGQVFHQQVDQRPQLLVAVDKVVDNTFAKQQCSQVDPELLITKKQNIGLLNCFYILFKQPSNIWWDILK